MHINVRDFQAESVGYSRAYKITGERPSLDTVRLTEDIEGETKISRLESGLLAEGQVHTTIELVCDRCLRTFSRPVSVKFRQLFADDPGDDEMPIVDHEIDLAHVVEQEIVLSLPIKVLHSPDCEGIAGTKDKYTRPTTGNRLQDQARITKGTKRGRT